MPALMLTPVISLPVFTSLSLGTQSPSPLPSPSGQSLSKPWTRGIHRSSNGGFIPHKWRKRREARALQAKNWQGAVKGTSGEPGRCRAGAVVSEADDFAAEVRTFDAFDQQADKRELTASNSSSGSFGRSTSSENENPRIEFQHRSETSRTFSPRRGRENLPRFSARENEERPNFTERRAPWKQSNYKTSTDGVWEAPKRKVGSGGEESGSRGKVGEGRENDSEIEQMLQTDTGQRLDAIMNKYLWSEYPPNPKERASWPERSNAIMEVQSSDHLDDALRRVGSKLETSDLNALLRRFGRMGKWQEASALFNWMKANGMLSAPSYTSFFSVLGKTGRVQLAIDAFLALKDKRIRSNIYVWNSFLSTLVSNGKVDRVFHFFQLLQEEGLEPDMITYSTMISACSKLLGGFYKAQELVKEMRAKGLKLDSIMYGALISVCASNHMVEKARATFEEMRSEGLVPNIFHFSSLLNAYALKGKHEEAEFVVLELKRCGLQPNKVVFNSLINAYARANLPDMARETFNQMGDHGLQPDMISYCSLMNAYAKVGRVEEAHELINQMKASGFKPGSDSYRILIAAYGKSGSPDKMMKLSQEIDTLAAADLNIRLINSLLKVYCEVGFMDGVMSILQKMDSHFFSPNRITFHILMKYFCEEDLCDLAIRTLKDMQARGYPANEASYTILLQGFVRNGKLDDCFQLLKEMQKSGTSPSKIVYHQMMSYCICHKMLNEAQQLFKEIKASRRVISGTLLEAYLELFVKEGRLEVVKDVLQLMRTVHFNPKQELWDLILLKAYNQTEYGMVKELLNVEQPKCMPSPKVAHSLIDCVGDNGNVDLLEKLEASEIIDQVV